MVRRKFFAVLFSLALFIVSLETRAGWVQLGSEIYGGGNQVSASSVSLSSDGSTVALGTSNNFGNRSFGHVRIFSFDSESSTWTQLGSDIDGESEGDWSGHSVSLSSDGSTVAIGAPSNDDDSGHVRIFSFDSEFSTWTQLGSDLDGESKSDFSGYSVSLSSDGTSVSIGGLIRLDGQGPIRIYFLDTDDDGIGDYEDTDDDGDGVPDVDDAFPLDPTKFQPRGSIVNVSARVTLGSGEMVTPGFVVRDVPTKLLIRAVGPRLGDFGVYYLPNPRMTIFDSSRNVVTTIDDWRDDNLVSELSDLMTATASAGAFPLAQDTASAATLVTLDPGAYTVQVDSADEGVGDVLVEVYEISE